MTRVVLSKNWARKPKARHFRIRDESKARTAEKKWLAKSKGNSKGTVSQAETAKRFGVHQSHISRIQSGYREY